MGFEMTRPQKRKSRGLLISGGPIVTIDPVAPRVEAVACLHGRIIWVGNLVDKPRIPGVRWQHLDLNGRLLLPAFCDGHTHFLFTALGKTRIGLNDTSCLKDALKKVRTRLPQIPKSGWALGEGFDLNLWPDDDRLHKKDLDTIIPDRPAAFFSKDEHALWVNSLALQAAGIGPDTPDPVGGVIHRDPVTREPTGYLTENAYRLVWNIIPPLPLRRSEQLVRAAFAEAHQVGVTQIHDVSSERSFKIFQSLYLKGKLKLRVLHAMPVESLPQVSRTEFRSGFGDELLRLGPIKVFLDGALGSHTAHLKRPYSSNRNNYGIPIYTGREFSDIVKRAYKAGWAVAVHAIGDAAVRRALDAFLKHRRSQPQAIKSRIEHVQLINPADIADLQRSGVVASMQPSHLLADRDTAIKHWGRRARWAFAFRSLQEAGIPLVFGSDTPIERLNPLAGIHAAVNRQLAADPRGPWTPAERLTVYEAVAGFTSGAAYVAGETAIKGSITPGKVADFVVLSENIFSVPAANIVDAAVEITIFDGQVVYNCC
jgi:predicted amidohydrolase YtcJ